MNAMIRRFDAALIDLDGTLLDTAHDLANAANRMLAALGRPARDLRTLTSYIGKGIPRIVHRAITGDMNADADPQTFARGLELYERFYAEESGASAPVFDGVVDGLRAFQNAGIKLACVTNKTTRFTGALLERTGLAHWFELVVCGDTLERRKPDPLPFTHACKTLAAAPNRSLVIGDSINDVQAGRAAGCIVFCVPYGYREGGAVETLGADRIVATLLEAAQISTGAIA